MPLPFPATVFCETSLFSSIASALGHTLAAGTTFYTRYFALGLFTER